ncbi:hypothetical protein CRM79_01750 [Pantoea agglomerans]|nr:hypothetical protein CRM79_01750 [Pantoea agglomerans]
MSLQLRLYKLSELCRQSPVGLIFYQHNHYDNKLQITAYLNAGLLFKSAIFYYIRCVFISYAGE